MSPAIRIAAIGECMIELSDPADDRPSLAFGGDTLNTAVYLARLAALHGGQVDYVTALGDDPYSEEMLRFWQGEGVGTDHVARLPGRLPGLYAIRTDAAGERSFYYWRSAAAAREMMQGAAGERIAAALKGLRLIYLSGITLSILDPDSRARLISAIAAARAVGATIAFDSNYRPRGWDSADAARAAMDELLRHVDIALPGLDDERALRGVATAADCAAALQALGVAEICVKDGAGPCLVVGRGGEAIAVAPREPVRPVDTTAAGDSFNAAYLAARLGGAGLIIAAEAGHRLAGAVIRHRGAIIPAPAMPAVGPEGAE
jgi:2-dehydro-3-deoxygluconokinase